MKLTMKLLALIFSVVMLANAANAESPREQLRQMVEQLQKSPNDNALRENIIALALTLKPKPATPDAVAMAEGAAEYAFKHAQTNSDFSEAAKQYEKALLQAPWLADDYYNCGVAHEKAGENKEAIRSFNLYLLAAPNANDALDIKKRIGGLQYAAQKAEDEANRPAKQAAAKQDVVPPTPVIQRFECPGNRAVPTAHLTFDFSKHEVLVNELNPPIYRVFPFTESADRRLLWDLGGENSFDRSDMLWRHPSGGHWQCQRE